MKVKLNKGVQRCAFPVSIPARKQKKTALWKKRHEWNHGIEVDFMENFVILKKEQKGYTHNHGHKHDKGSEIGKLQKLLPYLLSHNKGRTADIEKWALKTEEAGYQEVAQELKTAIELFNDVNNHFEKALSYL